MKNAQSSEQNKHEPNVEWKFVLEHCRVLGRLGNWVCKGTIWNLRSFRAIETISQFKHFIL